MNFKKYYKFYFLDSLMEIQDIQDHYNRFKPIIKQRIIEFEERGKKGEKEIFRELCFCLLTAGTSAELGIKTIDYLGETIFNGNEEDIIKKLEEIYRFHHVRGRFIFLARQNFDINILNLSPIERREEIVKKIKGIGYKEASHFLRNIGYKNYAILDKHIINCLYELGVLENNIPPKNPKNYLEFEKKMKQFSKDIGIDFDELDLVLWSFKTGKVLK